MRIKEELLIYVNCGVNVDLIKRYSACVGVGLGVALLTIAGFVGFVFWIDSKKKVKCTSYPTTQNADDPLGSLRKLEEFANIKI